MICLKCLLYLHFTLDGNPDEQRNTSALEKSCMPGRTSSIESQQEHGGKTNSPSSQAQYWQKPHTGTGTGIGVVVRGFGGTGVGVAVRGFGGTGGGVAVRGFGGTGVGVAVRGFGGTGVGVVVGDGGSSERIKCRWQVLVCRIFAMHDLIV